ncbi:MAG TPA: YncE family protein, partial [Acidimicrobiia bacterium]|nr:YncE family protein [Acidimicrobiia bacterium]
TSYEEGVVERLDPVSNTVVYQTRLGGNPNGITEGFGAVWVADTANGLLYRLDPEATGLSG